MASVVDVRHRIERRPGRGLELSVHVFEPDIGAFGEWTVLLLHGFLDAGGTWDLVAQRLVAEGHRVIAPDQRGFGRSDRVGPGGYYHFYDYVADIDALVGSFDPERRLAVVGHSMGGAVASMFAGARPDRVERLVVCEGLGPPSMEPAVAVQRTRRWLDQLEQGKPSKPLKNRADALKRLAAFHGKVEYHVLESRVEHLADFDEGGGGRWRYDPLHRTSSPQRFDRDAFLSFVKAVHCPVMFVSGGPSGFHPEDESIRLAAFSQPVKVVELA
ncbi:MAG: alpha/beta hydrolase, partial [Myxococcota bacterium]